MNSVFLLALCFAIAVEAIQRLTTGDATVSDPDTLMYVGIAGLIFNLVALGLLHKGHSHGGVGNSLSSRPQHVSSGQHDAENAVSGECLFIRIFFKSAMYKAEYWQSGLLMRSEHSEFKAKTETRECETETETKNLL